MEEQGTSGSGVWGSSLERNPRSGPHAVRGLGPKPQASLKRKKP